MLANSNAPVLVKDATFLRSYCLDGIHEYISYNGNTCTYMVNIRSWHYHQGAHSSAAVQIHGTESIID